MTVARLVFVPLAACLAACLGVAGCSERDQSLKHKVDVRAADSPATPYTAGSWKAGDETGWEAQIRTRAQGQNEYSRSGSPP